MLRHIASRIKRNYRNAFGIRTTRKIVVFESDDWGAIRMPSVEVYSSFLRNGWPVDQSLYNRLDSLESNDDLARLIEVLTSVRDREGKFPKFTLNSIMANPDFERIEASDYQQYFYERFPETLLRYPDRDKVLSLYDAGISADVFRPQFHGREHLNIQRWMRSLRDPESLTRTAFRHKTTYSGTEDYSFMEAFDIDSSSEHESHIQIVTEGLQIFREIFGFTSFSFIAPCTVWHDILEDSLRSNGVRFLQSGFYQLSPLGGINNYGRLPTCMGKRKSSGLVQMHRNCVFEPSDSSRSDWVDYALGGIADAFRWKKPAVVGTHRINFVGSLYLSNRDRGLADLARLLQKILKRWPDVEFLFSDELGEYLENANG